MMDDSDAWHPIDRIWLALSSARTTALLTVTLAVLAGVSAVVPQGGNALELIQFEEAEVLRRLAAWGLTSVFDSAWIRAIGLLLVINVFAVVLRGLRTSRRDEDLLKLPAEAPHEAELTTPLPERAVEAMRTNFRAALGAAPSAEKVEGARVTMVFETSPRGDLWPMLTHIGLALLVVGAGLLVAPTPRANSVVRAKLEVTDSRSRSTGSFDLAQGEAVKFFQWRTEFVIRDYVASKDGLGPAIRMERFEPGGQRRSDFWIYRDAPPGFDAKHRRGFVAIEARSMGLQPAPGHGLSSRPWSGLLLIGLSCIVLGGLGSSRAMGRLYVEAEGDQVRILGVPKRAGDSSFAKSFERLSLIARAALSQP